MEQEPEQLPPGIKRSPSGRVPKWVIDEAMGIPSTPTPTPAPAPAKKKRREPEYTSYDSYDDEQRGVGWGRSEEPERVYTTPRSVRLTIVACIFGIPVFIGLLSNLG